MKVVDYNPECFAKIFERLYNYMKNEELCDVVIIAGVDGKRVSAHRIVLAASSDYFTAMFTGSMRESKDKEVQLKDISGDILETIVGYCYTGRLELQEQTIENLIETANYLQFNSVVEHCTNFIVGQLNVSNCLHFYIIGNKHNLGALLKSTIDFITKHFMEVSQNPTFLDLEVKEVIEFIAKDDIEVESEEWIFSAVKKWIEHNLESRKDFLTALLYHVRVPLLSPRYILEHVEPLCNTKDQQTMVLDAMRYSLVPNYKWTYSEKLLENRKKVTNAVFQNFLETRKYNRLKTRRSYYHLQCHFADN